MRKRRVPKPRTSKAFWDAAARDRPAWYIATSFTEENDEFFASGRREVDTFLAFAGVSLNPGDSVLEIGCGTGRMTRRLSELAGRVVAVDVSPEMLQRAQRNLADLPNVQFVEVTGNGELPGESRSLTAVFSYITMQHVPSADSQGRYFREALRLIAPGGWVLIQFRRPGVVPRVLDWAGHLGHRIRGRSTLNKAWRGALISQKELLGPATAGIAVEILPHGRRHIWARARRAVSS